jgi:hypothetical protein
MAKIKIKKFATKAEECKWLVDNLDVLKAQRRSEPKKTDSFGFVSFAINERGERLKAESEEGDTIDDDKGVLKVRCIINTTGLLDSHGDVHIPGIWKKTLLETKVLYLCQEHQLTFEGIISDDLKGYTKTYTWKELGFDFEGETEALVFDATVKEDRNEFMYCQYKKGYVRNHSVRMVYMKEYFCINSSEADYAQYKDSWDKFISYVANKEDAETKGYFWAITEAKVIEGSAVVRGSNYATPTLDVVEDKSQADNSLDNNEPPAGTQPERKKVFIN